MQVAARSSGVWPGLSVPGVRPDHAEWILGNWRVFPGRGSRDHHRRGGLPFDHGHVAAISPQKVSCASALMASCRSIERISTRAGITSSSKCIDYKFDKLAWLVRVYVVCGIYAGIPSIGFFRPFFQVKMISGSA